MKAGGGTDGLTVSKHLRAVSLEGKAYGATEYAAAVAGLDAIENIDYVGVSGEVDLDAQGDTVAPYDIWMVQSGQITTIEHALTPQ